MFVSSRRRRRVRFVVLGGGIAGESAGRKKVVKGVAARMWRVGRRG